MGSRIGPDNLVLHARAARHVVNGFSAPTSIKTVVSGEVIWVVGGRLLLVDPSSLLLIAGNEKYSMDIRAERPVETCCVFFGDGFVEQVAADMTQPLAQSFERRQSSYPALAYLSALHRQECGDLVFRVQSLARRCKHALAPSGFEEQFLDLAAALLQLYEQIRGEMARVPAARAGTKQELFRRLLVGRDYLHSSCNISNPTSAKPTAPVSLLSVSKAAGLSPFHFHRCFTQAFQQTPHAYLTKLRLARAREQILRGASVLEACVALGFSSTSSFARLFRAHYGEPPSALHP